MKIGYSISIGEHVDATDIDYADISDFKIVCPICREPVHKVERGDQHFLSHKHKRPGDDAECELRVASLSRAQLDALDSVSRGQTLEAFFRDLPEMIDAVMPRERGGVPDWRTLMEANRSRGDALRMRTAHRQRIKQTLTGETVGSQIDRVLEERRPAYAVAYAGTRLNRHVQRRAALDMFRTVMTSNGRIGFEALYWAAWAISWINYEMHPDLDADYAVYANEMGGTATGPTRSRIIEHLAHATAEDRNFDRLVRRSSKDILWKNPMGERMSVENQVVNDIYTALTRMLTSLDYVGAARRRRAEGTPGT